MVCKILVQNLCPVRVINFTGLSRVIVGWRYVKQYGNIVEKRVFFLQLDSPRRSVSQPPGRGPVPGPGINYTGPREVLLEFVILVF